MEVLSEADRQTPCYRKVRALIEGRIVEHRAKNDGDLDATLTARTRGRIAECKALLALVEPSPAKPAEG
jgi:hypothetical protein